MKYVGLAVVLAVFSVSCGSTSTPTTPAVVNPTFTAAMLPANEAPNPITNAESTASGSVVVTFVTTKDTAGNVTSAVGTAVVTMQGFPAGSSVTLAHIHTGATGVAGPVLVPFLPPNGTTAVVNGGLTFTQTTNLTGDQATSIINNPAGFYFNVHTALNPGGVMRAQLVKTQ
jgi:CHRD domain